MGMPFGNQQFAYNVDIVMCIDVTGSMGPIINKVKETALTLPATFLAAMDDVGKHADAVRFKVIAFGDYAFDERPMAESEFFTADQASEFEAYVNNLVPSGGGDIPENALEALALAFKSDWCKSGSKRRHVTILFTDAPALALGERAECANYTPGMPASLAELVDWYSGLADQTVGLKLEQKAKRLVLYAPHAEPWDDMGEIETVIHTPINPADGGSEIDIPDVMELLFSSL
jgi:hypothetical protein